MISCWTSSKIPPDTLRSLHLTSQADVTSLPAEHGPGIELVQDAFYSLLRSDARFDEELTADVLAARGITNASP